MSRILLVALLSVFTLTAAAAQESCSTQAGTKGAGGKPLAGAAKTSFMKKCCEDSAKSSEGKPLAGAAKDSYVKKCMAG